MDNCKRCGIEGSVEPFALKNEVPRDEIVRAETVGQRIASDFGQNSNPVAEIPIERHMTAIAE